MTKQEFAFGDRVRHGTRPEWGVGSVTKVEAVQVDGRPAQRLSVRFPGQGLKVLNTHYVELEAVADETGGTTGGPTGVRPSNDPLDASEGGEALERALHVAGSDHWLSGVGEKKIDEAMRSLPEAVRDPFVPAPRRLERTLDLYRYDRSGRGLMDWAVAQTGLDDPLSRFNRHELEQHFDRWAMERDAHLGRLIGEAELPPAELRRLVAAAPPAARRAADRAAALR